MSLLYLILSKDNEVLIKDEGIIENMLNELYYLKDVGEDNLDLIILVGNTQALSPEGQYLICRDILEFVNTLHMLMVGLHYSYQGFLVHMFT